jgi:hypothetical protein
LVADGIPESVDEARGEGNVTHCSGLRIYRQRQDEHPQHSGNYVFRTKFLQGAEKLTILSPPPSHSTSPLNSTKKHSTTIPRRQTLISIPTNSDQQRGESSYRHPREDNAARWIEVVWDTLHRNVDADFARYDEKR